MKNIFGRKSYRFNISASRFFHFRYSGSSYRQFSSIGCVMFIADRGESSSTNCRPNCDLSAREHQWERKPAAAMLTWWRWLRKPLRRRGSVLSSSEIVDHNVVNTKSSSKRLQESIILLFQKLQRSNPNSTVTRRRSLHRKKTRTKETFPHMFYISISSFEPEMLWKPIGRSRTHRFLYFYF